MSPSGPPPKPPRKQKKSIARKTSKLPTRIYAYGCRVRPECADLLCETLFRSGRYYNERVSLERDRRREYARIRAEHAPEIATLAAEYDDADKAVVAAKEAITGARVGTFLRTRQKSDKVPQELLDACKAAKDHRKEVGERLSAATSAWEQTYLAAARKRAASAAASSTAITTRGTGASSSRCVRWAA